MPIARFVPFATGPLLLSCYGAEPTRQTRVTPSPAVFEAPAAANGSVSSTALETEPVAVRLSAGEMVELGELGLMPIIFQALDEGGQAAECNFDDPFDMCQ